MGWGQGKNGRGQGMGDTQDEVEGDSLSDFYVLQEQGDAVQEISEAGPPFSHCGAMRRRMGRVEG